MNLATWIRTRRPTQIYYGWWVLVVTSAMMFFANGIFFRGFTVLFVPVRDDLRLTNFQASLVFSVARAEGGIEGPAVGWLIDRIGVRKPVVAGVLIGAVGYFAFSQVDSFLWFTLVFLGVVSLGSSVAFQHTMLAALNMWFIRRRALVFSLRAAAAALGGVALIPLVNIVIIRAGWQWSAIMSGFIYLLLILPLTLFLRPSPESMGLLPDGDLPGRVSRIRPQVAKDSRRSPLPPRTAMSIAWRKRCAPPPTGSFFSPSAYGLWPWQGSWSTYSPCSSGKAPARRLWAIS